MKLYRELAFADTRNCAKSVSPDDLSRFFIMNSLMLQPSRLALFFDRFVVQEFDLALLTKLVTSFSKQSIIENATVKVDGFSSEHRRTFNLTEINPNLKTSLTPQKTAGRRLQLRSTPHSATSAQRRRCQSANRIPTKSVETKAFQTDYINTDMLTKALRQFLRDQLKIDDELEDAKIKLVASKDFYLKQAF